MQISLKKFTLSLKHTFSISRESRDFQDTLIVGLSLDGKTGYGEATSNPYYNSTIESMMAQITSIEKELGIFEFTTPQVFHAFLSTKNLTNFTICALDLAAHDLYGKLLEKPLYEIWETSPVPLPYYELYNRYCANKSNGR